MNNNKLNKVLLWIIAGLLLIILVGSVFGLISRCSNKPEVLISKGKAENLNPPVDTSEIEYFDLGTLRIIPELEQNPESEDEEIATVMVVSPWLAYPAGDTVFYEELSRKQGVIKSVFTTYFATRTKNQILSETEDKITAALIEEINNKLSLGKISNIFFTDYIFLE